MTTRIGLVGCGYWGKNLIRNFAKAPNGELAYCCDLSQELLDRAKEAQPSVQTTQDYEEMLRAEIDAVAIATPVAAHYPLAKKALEAGKHVFVEKPLTDNVAHAEELVRLAEEKGLTLMVDHTFEYVPAINKLHELMQSGALGEIFYVRANWFNLGILQPEVNVVWDLGAHIFSILHYVLGEMPTQVRTTGSSFIRDNIEEVASVHLAFKDKKKATINVSWLEPRKVRQFVVVGREKTAVFDLMNQDAPLTVHEGQVEEQDGTFTYPVGEVTTPELESMEPLTEVCNTFVRAIQTGEAPRSEGKSGLVMVKLLAAAEESLRKNKEVIIDHVE